MAAREVLGRMACPDCGFPDAEIKRQKCGVKLYRFCPECNAQFFARTEKQGAAMARIIAPPPAVSPSVTVTEPEPKKAPPGAAPPVTVKAPKKEPPPAVPPVKEPPAKKPAPGSFNDAISFFTGGK